MQEDRKKLGPNDDDTPAYRQGCLHFLDTYFRNHVPMATLQLTTVYLSCVTITYDSLCELFCSGSIKCLTLDNVDLKYTSWAGSALGGLPNPTVTELNFYNASREAQSSFATILVFLGQSLETLRIHNPIGWRNLKEVHQGTMAALMILFGACGLLEDPVVELCPHLTQVEFAVNMESPVDEKVLLTLLPVPLGDGALTERLWRRTIDTFIVQFPLVMSSKTRDLPWTNIFL